MAEISCKNSYRLLDSGNFRKLEQVGQVRMIRPGAAAVWAPRLPKTEWEKADCEYIRGPGGEGSWKYFQKVPNRWVIENHGIKVYCQMTDFGHIGIFPEHHDCEALVKAITKFQKKIDRPFRLLNLFAYTGVVTLFGAAAGAEVVHLDASKTSVALARENAKISCLDQKPIRWIVDDALKFVSRQVTRGELYDGIVLDPPSFGRGTKGQVWKIEEHLPQLLSKLSQIMSSDFSYMRLSGHSPGIGPISLENLLTDSLRRKAEKGRLSSFEMAISDSTGRKFPSGASSQFDV